MKTPSPGSPASSCYGPTLCTTAPGRPSSFRADRNRLEPLVDVGTLIADLGILVVPRTSTDYCFGNSGGRLRRRVGHPRGLALEGSVSIPVNSGTGYLIAGLKTALPPPP